MVTYKCPSCGGELEISDTILSMEDVSADISYRLRVNTVIKHKDFVTLECGLIMQELAREVTKILQEQIESRSQDLHGL